MQKAAIQKAKTLLIHIARTYYENQPISSNTSEPPSTAQTAGKSGSSNWLDICEFDVVEAPRVATPKDRLLDEVKRYLKFEAGRGDLSDPLGWWKVHLVIGILA